MYTDIHACIIHVQCMCTLHTCMCDYTCIHTHTRICVHSVHTYVHAHVNELNLNEITVSSTCICVRLCTHMSMYLYATVLN